MSGFVLLLPLYAFVVADDDNFTYTGKDVFDGPVKCYRQ